MEAIGLFFTKFSDELLSAQIALLSFSLALGVYWMLIRKKKRESAEWVPAALVKAYLDRMRADERETRARLFGEEYAAPSAAAAPVAHGHATTVTQVVSNDPALQKEIEALRAQLAQSDSRAMEFDRTMNGLKAEKAALEQKLKDAAANPAAGAAAAGPDPKVMQELEDLRARIQEYDVVSEEIANIKILQKENEKLKARVGELEAGGAKVAAAPAAAPAAAEPAKTVAAEKAEPAPLTVVSGGKAEAAPAAAPAPAAAAPAATPAPAAAETNTNVLAPVTPSVETPAAAPAPAAAAAAPATDAAAAGAEKSSKQKEEELLSEFEKMLAS